METDLPVWSIRPNWKGGVLERLSWQTDVLASSIGVEQRRSLRLSPRRSIEITVNPTHRERSFLDLALHRLGGEEWLFPLWFDKGRLVAAAVAGATRVSMDTRWREHSMGDLALIYKDAFTWEVIGIASHDDNGLNLSAPLDVKWDKGAAIYPLRKALLPAENDVSALTSRVGESVLLFTINEANDYPAVMPDNVLYEGVPVVSMSPNRSETLTTKHTRLQEDVDNQLGLIYRRQQTERGFQVQSHNWMLHGRQNQAAFRSMLYWMRGRQRAVYLPSFNEDVVLSRAAAGGATNLDIGKVGMGYVGGVVPGRDLIRIGGQVMKLTEMGAPQSAQEERVRLAAPLTAPLPKGRPGAFLAASRLDTDTLELRHHTDSDGTMECGATFRTFNNIRDASGSNFVAIPATAKSAESCGSPEPDNNCAVVFPGWYWKFFLRENAGGGHRVTGAIGFIDVNGATVVNGMAPGPDDRTDFWTAVNDIPFETIVDFRWQHQRDRWSTPRDNLRPCPEDNFFYTATLTALKWNAPDRPVILGYPCINGGAPAGASHTLHEKDFFG